MKKQTRQFDASGKPEPVLTRAEMDEIKRKLKPYYEDKGIVIYHGDCREILPTLEPVDLVLTDPPYGVAYETAWRSRSDKLRVPVANDESLDVFAEVWPMVINRLADDRHWYVFASPRRIVEMVAIIGAYKNLIVWDKGDRGTVGDLTSGYGEAWEAIFYGMKGRRELFGKRPRTVLRYDWSATLDPVHPTVKSIDVLRRLIGHSAKQGETVLDPFMGSGTTLRAAKDLGLKAIGIELEEKYCEIAAKRLSQEVFTWE